MSQIASGPPSDFRSLLERVLAEVAQAHDREVEALRARPASPRRPSLPRKLTPMSPEEFPVGNPSGVSRGSKLQWEVSSASVAPREEACAPDGDFGGILPGALAGPSTLADEHTRSEPVGHSKNVRDSKRLSSISLGVDSEDGPRFDRKGTIATLALQEAQDEGLLSTSSKWSWFSAAWGETGAQSTTLMWQWLHRSGWREYKPEEAAQLESMFQGGYNKARLKSGKRGHHPMEIFFADMIQHDAESRKVRSVRRVGPDPWWRRLHRFCMSFYRSIGTGRPRMESFEQFYGSDIRRRRMDDSFSLGADYLKQPNNTHDGASHCMQRKCKRIVDGRAFTCLTTAILVMNAVWLAIDADSNEAQYLWDAGIMFQLIENLFCVAFTVEMVVRSLIFARARDAFADKLFALDFVCTTAMILETWLIPAFSWLAQGQSDVTNMTFGLLQLARLLRVSRVGRLVLIVPDLGVLLKGLHRSLRSVMMATFLLGILTVLCAIVFRTQVKHEWLGRCCWAEEHCRRCDGYFHSVPETILTLFFNGTLVDSVKKLIDIIRDESIFLTVVFICHVLLTHCVMLNLLIGIVCGVVAEVKETEEEGTEKCQLMWRLSDLMHVYDKNGNATLNMDELSLFIANPEVKRVLTEFQVDPWGLRTFMESYAASVAESSAEEHEGLAAFPFAEILDIVLRLRGGGGASVADIVNLRRFTGRRIETIECKMMESMMKDRREDKPGPLR